LISVRQYKAPDFALTLDAINAAAQVDRTRRISEAAFEHVLSGMGQGIEAFVATVTHRSKVTAAGFVWWDATKTLQRLEGWVHPDWRHRGVGTALLTAVESCVRPISPNGEITITARTYDDILGAPSLFRQRGFAEVRRFYVMSMSLAGQQFEQREADSPQGIVLRPFRERDLPALVAAENEIFVGHWGSQPKTAQAWRREMMDLRPHDPKLWVLAWEGDRIVGECLCHASRESGPNDGWVAIVGVRREWRGCGLGQVVLREGLRRLQQAGFVSAALHVDAENLPALNLYRRIGMEITRTRLHYAKEVRQVR
jgi:mycothiol synthase